MKICIKHLLLASILLISGNMAAQSLYVSSAMDEETISQAVLYSEGLYDLLPTYIETEEDKIITSIAHKNTARKAQNRTSYPCIENISDTDTTIGAYAENIHTDKDSALRLSLRDMGLQVANRVLSGNLSTKIYNEKIFVDIYELQRYLTSVYELSDLLKNDLQISCTHIDSIDNYYIVTCAGNINRELCNIKSNQFTTNKSLLNHFQEYYCSNPNFQTWAKKEITHLKKVFYLYDSQSPLVKEEVEGKMQEFKKALIEAMNNPEAK